MQCLTLEDGSTEEYRKVFFKDGTRKERRSACVLSLCVCLSGINASIHSRQTQWVKCEKCLNSHLSPEENIMYSEKKKEDWRRTESGATFSRRLVLHTHSAARHDVLTALLAAGQQRAQNCSDLKETQRIMEEANDLWKLRREKQNKAPESWCAQLLWLQSREMSCRFSPFFRKGTVAFRKAADMKVSCFRKHDFKPLFDHMKVESFLKEPHKKTHRNIIQT